MMKKILRTLPPLVLDSCYSLRGPLLKKPVIDYIQHFFPCFWPYHLLAMMIYRRRPQLTKMWPSLFPASFDCSKLWGPRTQLMQICMISILLGNNKKVAKTEYLLFHCTCYVSDTVWSPFLGITSFSHSNNYVRKLLSLFSRWRKSLQRNKKKTNTFSRSLAEQRFEQWCVK